MLTPKCGCSERNPIACLACQELAERESVYESNVDPLYRDKASALETEDWKWEVLGGSRSDDDDDDNDDLPDYM